MKELTQELLTELLHYNLDTGIFTWKVKLSRRIKIGSIAGCMVNRYTYIGINGKLHLSHRLAFLYVKGSMPKRQVDHIDHDRFNNRFSNLREVTHAQNNRNVSISKANTSGCTGVHFHKRHNKWMASICFNYETIHLGCFNEIDDAIKVRREAEVKYGFHKNHGSGKAVQ